MEPEGVGEKGGRAATPSFWVSSHPGPKPGSLPGLASLPPLPLLLWSLFRPVHPAAAAPPPTPALPVACLHYCIDFPTDEPLQPPSRSTFYITRFPSPHPPSPSNLPLGLLAPCKALYLVFHTLMVIVFYIVVCMATCLLNERIRSKPRRGIKFEAGEGKPVGIIQNVHFFECIIGTMNDRDWWHDTAEENLGWIISHVCPCS